jgi:hypothetical protein
LGCWGGGCGTGVLCCVAGEGGEVEEDAGYGIWDEGEERGLS